ncbi:hypothetical protein BTI_466 [Burkholderia thailandensis MSMB121]|uniref:hypothetical protein n=1 Tax=Burkholderia humptydooensis TaxID=430531 RepID=UPI000327FD53|nr:hypothetical protein [Burkholderia humptydooensis]AGK48760.1 hypothetical protein BTI_466 [Burkholderia thailandensis MSMB121]ATF35671.1 hypothetical protein CO709_21405 [Burkholderia thailandensis]KST73075.1 hypothetical protein WS76_02125 [Burkholderia humptydooensis]
MLIQKFHSGIQLGQPLSIAKYGTRLFSRQGHWDGGSTLHCVAMGLALLNKLTDPVGLSYHARGNERTVWDHAWPHYLHGLTLSELASFVAELNLGVQPVIRSGLVSDVLHFVAGELSLGRPVIVGWRQRRPVRWHAALAVGIEGRQEGRTFTPHALLLLDPAGYEPGMAGYNARLDVHGPGAVRYRSSSARLVVTIKGVISMRLLVDAADANA